MLGAVVFCGFIACEVCDCLFVWFVDFGLVFCCLFSLRGFVCANLFA